MQDREGLWPKGDLVPVKKQTAAIQIQDITIETAVALPVFAPESGYREWSSVAYMDLLQQ